MDIYEVRRRNARTILATDFEGNNTKLAEALGIEPTYISRWWSSNPNQRRNIGSNMARKLERAGHRRKFWLDQDHTEGALRPVEMALTVPIIDLQEVPKWLKKTSQKGLTNTKEYETVATPGGIADNCYAIRVQGESMEPRFPAGSIAIVSPDSGPESGSYVVVLPEGASTPLLRRLAQEGSQQLLVPENDRYPVLELTGRYLFCGRVVRIQQDIP